QNVRLGWFDPVAGTYATISASEVQQTGRSVTLPAARGDGTRDFVLVADLVVGAQSADIPPATLTFTGVDVTATGTGNATVAIDPAVLTLTGQAPTATGTGTATVTVDAATLTLTGQDVTA